MHRSEISPRIASLMSPKDQEYYGFVSPGLHAKDEAHPPVKTGSTEKKEQSDFWNYLCLNGYVPGAVWHRMDRASTSCRGTPDFIVPLFWGRERVLWIEFKVAGNWLSEDQEAFDKGLQEKNHTLYVCFSAGEAIALLKQKDRLT